MKKGTVIVGVLLAIIICVQIYLISEVNSMRRDVGVADELGTRVYDLISYLSEFETNLEDMISGLAGQERQESGSAG